MHRSLYLASVTRQPYVVCTGVLPTTGTPVGRIDQTGAEAHDGAMNATLPPPQILTEQQVADEPSVASEPPRNRTPREYVRPRHGRRIGGVCAAIADRHGWSRTTVRLVVALSVLLPGPQVIAYVIAWIVMPSDDEVAAPVPPA